METGFNTYFVLVALWAIAFDSTAIHCEAFSQCALAPCPSLPSRLAPASSLALGIGQRSPRPKPIFTLFDKTVSTIEIPVNETDIAVEIVQEEELIDSDLEEPKETQFNDSDEIPIPSIQRIVTFAIPAVGVYLCSPLLSMIDTSTIGLFCGTLQQASLNPAVTITDYSARTMSFLYTGTTNMIAVSSSGDKIENSDQVKDTLVGALRLAFFTGTALATLLLLTSQRLLVPLVGNANIDARVLDYAWKYCSIRALGMPAAAMIGTSQAACLGLQDNKTSFQIIIAAAVLNLVLDVALVGRKAAWIGGTAGVAWATTVSQYFALGLFLRRFSRKNSNADTINVDKKVMPSSKGFLHGKLTVRNFLRFPCQNTMDQFSPYIVPVTTTQIGRCSTYVAMGHVVSSTLDTVSMAAQQIITSIFYFLIPIGDSCSLAAQSFLPPIISRKADPQNPKRTRALKRTMKNIYKVSGILGIFLSMIAISIPSACKFISNDAAVTTAIGETVPIMLALLSTHGWFCASEGILLAFRDLKFLGRIYAMFFAVVPPLILRLKGAARAGESVNLLSVWNVFLGYHFFRISAFSCRVWALRRRSAIEENTELSTKVATSDVKVY